LQVKQTDRQTDRQTESSQVLPTGEYGGHHGSEHEKQQSKEEEPGVVVSLGRLVANVEVEQTNENATDHVTSQTQPCQRLSHTHTHTHTVCTDSCLPLLTTHATLL